MQERGRGGEEGDNQARERTYGGALIIEADTGADARATTRSAHQIFRDYKLGEEEEEAEEE